MKIKPPNSGVQRMSLRATADAESLGRIMQRLGLVLGLATCLGCLSISYQRTCGQMMIFRNARKIHVAVNFAEPGTLEGVKQALTDNFPGVDFVDVAHADVNVIFTLTSPQTFGFRRHWTAVFDTFIQIPERPAMPVFAELFEIQGMSRSSSYLKDFDLAIHEVLTRKANLRPKNVNCAFGLRSED